MSNLSAIMKLYEKSQLTKAEVEVADRLLTKLKEEIRGKQPISHAEMEKSLFSTSGFDWKMVQRYLESTAFDEKAWTTTIGKLVSISVMTGSLPRGRV